MSIYKHLSHYAPSQNIQSRIDCQHANELPVAGEYEFARRGLRIVRKRDVYKPDRLLLAAPARPRYTGDAHAEARTGALANTLGHRPGHLLAHGAVSFDQ